MGDDGKYRVDLDGFAVGPGDTVSVSSVRAPLEIVLEAVGAPADALIIDTVLSETSAPPPEVVGFRTAWAQIEPLRNGETATYLEDEATCHVWLVVGVVEDGTIAWPPKFTGTQCRSSGSSR
ncbi:hypothetical protein [Rubrivirga sp.]|uniref:hypothetical protein n=1 Tax=Rubrivirga sp. TaxID=1885344 RepID=UPI003C734A47